MFVIDIYNLDFVLCTVHIQSNLQAAYHLYESGRVEHMHFHVCMGMSRAKHPGPRTSMPTRAHAVPECVESHGTTWKPPNGHGPVPISSVHGCTWALRHTGIPLVGRKVPWQPGHMHSWYGMGMYVQPWRLHACMGKPVSITPGTIQMVCVGGRW